MQKKERYEAYEFSDTEAQQQCTNKTKKNTNQFSFLLG